MSLFSKCLKVFGGPGGYLAGREIEKKDRAQDQLGEAKEENEDLRSENEDLKRRLAEAEQSDQFFTEFSTLGDLEGGGGCGGSNL